MAALFWQKFHSKQRIGFKTAVQGELYNASTYDQLYQVISRLLSDRDDPVDLKADVQFKKLRKVVKARKEEAVRAGKVPGMWAAKSISHELLQEAFKQQKFSRECPRGLIRYVNYIMMTGFGQRAAQVKLSIVAKSK